LPTGLQIGAGAAVTSTERNNIQGTLVQTGNQLDVAIQGNGFFQIQLADGTLAYTRNGQFSKSATGQIVTQAGNVVAGAGVIPAAATSITINQAGVVQYTLQGNQTAIQAGQITMANFVNPAGLFSLGGGNFIPTPASETILRGGNAMNAGLDSEVYNRLLRERIIFLGSVVEDAMANAIAAQILLLSAEDPEKDIYLYINSPGGSISAGMAIYDTMQFVPNDVATVAMGLSASMGQFLLCAGAPGKRYALPHARIMMHQPSGGIGGTATDIRIQAEQIGFTKKKMAELIAFHTGQKAETITADSDRDRWFTAEEAKEYGFVDHVVKTAAQIGKK